MPFRPNELKLLSGYTRRVLQCLLCGHVVKKSTKSNPKTSAFVGCRNNALLASRMVRDPRKDSTERVHMMASYYSRLAEHFDLAGPHIGEAAFNRQRFKRREEQNGLKSLIYHSLLTTIQAHFKISRTPMVEKYGWKPGGYPVPDEERPLRFQFHFNHGKFQPWPCARREGCVFTKQKSGSNKPSSSTCSSKDAVETTDESAVPEALEACILHIIEAAGKNRRFKTLHKLLQEESAFFRQEKPSLLVILKQLQKEGKVAMNLETTPRHPKTSLTNLGRRRLMYLKPADQRGK